MPVQKFERSHQDGITTAVIQILTTNEPIEISGLDSRPKSTVPDISTTGLCPNVLHECGYLAVKAERSNLLELYPTMAHCSNIKCSNDVQIWPPKEWREMAESNIGALLSLSLP